MTLKGDAKFKRKLTRGLKNDVRIWVNFHVSTRKPGKLYFDGLFLLKSYNFLARKFQRNYVS